MAGDSYAGNDAAGANPKEKAPRTKEEKRDADMVGRARRRKCVMFDADQDNRSDALEDIEFLHVPGAQYSKAQKDARGDRPCYEFNELRVKALRVINDMRQNRPQVKVRATKDTTKDMADIREGLIRNIWSVSRGDDVTDYAADYQVSGGMGAWRVETVWSDDTTWEQDIRLRAFKNPFTLWCDPAASDALKLDAEDWIVTEKITKASYERRWPDVTPVSFEDGDDQFDDDDSDWYGEEGVRICEYWYKEPTTKLLGMLSTGETIELKQQSTAGAKVYTTAEGAMLPEGVEVKRVRKVPSHKIMMCIVSGSSILEAPTEWPGKYFPFIQVFGEWRVIGGKVKWHGLTRFSKDAQRLANVTMTAIAETVMTAPMAHFWATTKQAEGHVEKWKEAHKKNIPYLPYTADPETQGTPPTRMGSADVPVALMEMRGISADLLKGTSGIFDASVGAQSNETSGRAINARTRQGEVATFNYNDNMAKAACQSCIIIDDLISKIYTADRTVRVLGPDLAEKYVRINQVVQNPDGSTKVLNDLSAGKFDVTMTVGPSFSTRRQEATEMYTQLGQTLPQVWTVAGDLIMKSMDLPYAEQIAERMKSLLPAPIQKQMQDGKELPPEVMAAMQTAETMMQNVQAMGQAAQEASMQAKTDSAKAKSDAADVEVKLANLKTQEAQFAADVAKFQTAQAEAALAAAQGGMSDEFRTQTAEALEAIRQTATDLFVRYAEQLQGVHAQGLASTAVTPRKRTTKLTRQPDGSYVAESTDAPLGQDDGGDVGGGAPPPAAPTPPPMRAAA